MDDLIAALQIFQLYTTKQHPTGCEHDALFVLVDPQRVSAAHIAQLEKLGFIPDGDSFVSYRFG